jgi:hypothetical protein
VFFLQAELFIGSGSLQPITTLRVPAPVVAAPPVVPVRHAQVPIRIISNYEHNIILLDQLFLFFTETANLCSSQWPLRAIQTQAKQLFSTSSPVPDNTLVTTRELQLITKKARCTTISVKSF